MSDYIPPHKVDTILENIQVEVTSPPSIMRMSTGVWTKGWYYDPGGRNTVCRWCSAVLDFRPGGCFNVVMMEHKQACTFYHPGGKKAHSKQSMEYMLPEVEYLLTLLGCYRMQVLLTRILKKMSLNRAINIAEECAWLRTFINTSHQGREPAFRVDRLQHRSHAQNNYQNGPPERSYTDHDSASANVTIADDLAAQENTRQSVSSEPEAKSSSADENFSQRVVDHWRPELHTSVSSADHCNGLFVTTWQGDFQENSSAKETAECVNAPTPLAPLASGDTASDNHMQSAQSCAASSVPPSSIEPTENALSAEQQRQQMDSATANNTSPTDLSNVRVQNDGSLPSGSSNDLEPTAHDLVPGLDVGDDGINDPVSHAPQAGSGESPCVSLRSARALRQAYDGDSKTIQFTPGLTDGSEAIRKGLARDNLIADGPKHSVNPTNPGADIFRVSVEKFKRTLEDHGSSIHPRHPEFAVYERRLQTFDPWRDLGRCGISPEAFANANFFYSGHFDRVTCYYCGGDLQSWRVGRNPRRRHRRYFPRCRLSRSPA